MQDLLHDWAGYICTVTGIIIAEVIVIENKVLDSLLFLTLSLSLRLHRYGEA